MQFAIVLRCCHHLSLVLFRLTFADARNRQKSLSQSKMALDFICLHLMNFKKMGQ